MPDGAQFPQSLLAATPFQSAEPIYVYVDIETRSACNLLSKGLYVYAEHPSTDILLLSYVIGDEPKIQTWYIHLGHPMPDDLRQAILNPLSIFIAHNAGFERVMLTVVGKAFLEAPVHRALCDISRWSCTAARCAAMGLPRSLDNAGHALGLKIQKDKDGYNLMLSMCAPIGLSPDGKYVWKDDRVSLQRLGEYCEVDVAVERLIHEDVPLLSPFEQAVWSTTERMNDRGISVDAPLLNKLLMFTADAEQAASKKIFDLTDGAVRKVTNASDLRKWMVSKGVTEAETDGVGKWMLQRWLEDDSLPDLLREVLTVRKEGGKSSTKKFVAIAGRLNLDNRIRGSLLYCGAASTSRFSSRGAQLQNLPRGITVKDMIAAIADIMDDVGMEAIRKHGPPLVVASEMARPVFVASPHAWLARGDYSQIEARVDAWISGETWKVQAFADYDIFTGEFDAKGKPKRKGADLYTMAAALIFGIPPEQVTPEQRQVGKVSELACGFAGGVKALQAMARLYNIKLTDEQAEQIKQRWRLANPKIEQFWHALNYAALMCMNSPIGEKISVAAVQRMRSSSGEDNHINEGLWFKRNRRALALRVPNGGALIYWYPELRDVVTPWGETRKAVTFMAEDSQKHIWVRHSGYGGLFCENVCQKVARDIMAAALVRLDQRGLDPRLTVHDEAVCQIPWSLCPTADEAKDLVEQEMMVPLSWTAGLPIAADGSAAQRYLKS